MRILQLIQKQQLRGAEVFAAQLSQHLSNAGHEVLIVSLLPGDAQLPFSGKIISLDANLKKRFADWASWKKLSQLIKAFKPDVIQANAGDTLKYAILSKQFFRWKQAVIFRNASMVSHYIKNPVSHYLNAFFYKRVDYVVSVSENTKKDIQQLFSIPDDKITVKPVGVELTGYKRLPEFDNGLINLVHVGGFSFEKNHEGLVRIFELLIKTQPNICLWLVGEGKLKNKIEEKAGEKGLREKIKFVGFVNNPLDYIHSADVLVLPSIIEGLAAVILEAFYCKTPVVAYAVGGIGELVKNGETGWLINKGDEKAFASAVLEVVNGDQLKKGIIINKAYETLMSSYYNKQIAERFILLYQRIINAHG